MKGSEIMLLQFMDSASNRYIIPVYQRKYSWKIDNCRQLYDDLKKMIVNQRSSHFFWQYRFFCCAKWEQG